LVGGPIRTFHEVPGWHCACVPPSRSTRSTTAATTSAKEALRFAAALARSCSRALGETVAGVILHGSLTLGDYLPGRSDVDWSSSRIR
jgi:hypothetical protein